MIPFLAGAFIALLAFVLLLNLVSLPANWIILGLLFVWKLAGPTGAELTWGFLGLLFGLALFGEIVEFVFQIWAGKQFGSSNKGNIAGIVGAIAGALLGAGFLLGFGAVIGALGGAFAGCYLMERHQGHSRDDAFQAACGVLLGRFFGMALKTGIGAAIIILSVVRIWPLAQPLLEGTC